MHSLRNILVTSGHSCLLVTTPRRYLQKEIRQKIKEKQHSKHLALEYFDFFYGSVFGSAWNKMRLAMLTDSKYVALVNNYSDIGSTLKRLENQASMDLFDFALKHELAAVNKKKINDNLERLDHLQKLKIPPALRVYGFDNGQTTKFDSPEPNESRLLDYYCLDASSVLPVLAMNIQKNDHILDLCASPGGKTLVMLQTLLPS